MNKVICSVYAGWNSVCLCLCLRGCVEVRRLTDIKGVAAGDEHCSYTWFKDNTWPVEEQEPGQNLLECKIPFLYQIPTAFSIWRCFDFCICMVINISINIAASHQKWNTCSVRYIRHIVFQWSRNNPKSQISQFNCMLLIPKPFNKWNICNIWSNPDLHRWLIFIMSVDMSALTQKPILPWCTREPWVHMALMKRSTQMGCRSFFLSLLWKISVPEINPITVWGLKWRSELRSLYTSEPRQSCIVKASWGIYYVMVRTGWNGQKELQTVLRLTFHLSNLWCLKKRKEPQIELLPSQE